MNIDIEGYTREQLEAALFSSTRIVRYEYTISNALDQHIGMIEISDGAISYDSSAEVMRTFSGKVKKSDLLNIDCLDYKITPWMCLLMPNGKEAKWPLGKFIVVPSESVSNDIVMVDIVGYDLGKIALDDKNESRFYVGNRAVYTSALSQMLGEIYIRRVVEESELTKSFEQEWEIGTPKITIANDLLRAVNYDPLHFDENGVCVAKPHIEDRYREIDFQYIADKTSIIVDDMSLASNKFDIPNKWIRYTENPEAPYLISTFVNDDENSPYSTVNRGRFIVDTAVVEDIANQATLDAYTARIASEAMRSTDSLTISTLNMPGHGFRECLLVDIPRYGISGKYIETAWEMSLQIGGTMTHILERSVIL